MPVASNWSGDTLVVFDIDQAKVVRYLASEYVDEIKIPTEFVMPVAMTGSIEFVAVTSDGSVLLQQPLAASASPDSSVLSILLQRPGTADADTVVGVTVRHVEWDQGRIIQPGTATAVVTVGADGWLAQSASDGSYRIAWGNRDLSRQLCAPVSALPVTSGERGASGVSQGFEDIAEAIADTPTPTNVNAVGRIVVSSVGDLWVERRRPRPFSHEKLFGPPGGTMDNFGSSGNYLGRVVIPDRVSIQAVSDSVAVGIEFGDFDDPHTEFLWDELDPLIERGGEHAQFAKEAAAESLVLLRNDNDMLPLDAEEMDSIALIGAEWFAGEATLPPRSGNREENISVVEPYQVTPQEGLEEVLDQLGSDATVTYNSGDSTAEAVELAEESDVTILVIGDVARETWDKNSNWREENPGGGANGAENEIPDLDLPSVEGTNQQLLIERVLDADPDTIVVLKTQGQVNMPRLDDMHTLVQAWYPGQEDGAVVAEALFGVTNFSGKLPMTIGATDREAAFATQLQYPGQLEDTGVPGGIGRDPLCNDPDEAPPCEVSGPAPQRVVRYLEDLEMGYRWYEANDVEPRFPFGFGLSYTTFAYSNLVVTPTTGATGTGVGARALMIRCSRSMSWAVARTWPVGGRRRTQARPVVSETR